MLLIWMTWVKRQLAKKAKADVTAVGHLFTPCPSNPKIGQLKILPNSNTDMSRNGSPIVLTV